MAILPVSVTFPHLGKGNSIKTKKERKKEGREGGKRERDREREREGERETEREILRERKHNTAPKVKLRL